MIFRPYSTLIYDASPTRESRSHSLFGHKLYIHPINSSMVNTFNLHSLLLSSTFTWWKTMILKFLRKLVMQNKIFNIIWQMMKMVIVVPFLVKEIIFQPLTMILLSILRSKKICGEIILQVLNLFHFIIVIYYYIKVMISRFVSSVCKPAKVAKTSQQIVPTLYKNGMSFPYQKK